MKFLLVCAALIAAVSAGARKVEFFNEPQHQVQTRLDALSMCYKLGHHIAHENHILSDHADGYGGYASCGWTWDRRGRQHLHCNEFEADGKTCKQGKAEMKTCVIDGNQAPPKTGVYCRVGASHKPIPEGESKQVYRSAPAEGHNQLKTMNEAIAHCESEGSELATWTQAMEHITRYGITVCQESFLRELNAVYTLNCIEDGEIGWDIRDPDDGYDAICYGERAHKYIDPCAGEFPFRVFEGIEVVCDDGWIVVQARPGCEEEKKENGGYPFHQTWAQYRKGFGEYGKGYWLGLEALNKFTQAYDFELRIDMETAEGESFFARYGNIKVSNQEDQYRLSVKDYSGNAGDMLTEQQSNGLSTNGAQFSADPHDNDGSDFDCSKVFGSGWWFQSCHVDNLNGPCPNQQGYNLDAGVRWWKSVMGDHPSGGLRKTSMKIKYTGDKKSA